MEETLFAVDARVNMEEWASLRTYHELYDWREDLGLLERLHACIDARKEDAAATGWIDIQARRPCANQASCHACIMRYESTASTPQGSFWML
jgi:hypothetical protein